MSSRRLTTMLAICAAGFALGPAHATGPSPWVEDLHSAFRLIAGSAKKGAAPLRAGVEIKMADGWHTYWRYPGDSGVPPRFDFSGSKNLANAKVRFPAPQLITDETGNTLGYTGSIIFPVEVAPKDPRAPVTLNLKFDYAVCEKQCVPVTSTAQITLAPGESTEDAALTAAEARVPKPVAAAQLGLTARRVNDGPKPLVAVDLKAPAGAPVQVFAEGPTPEWALPIPKPAPGAPEGHRQFGFELDGLPPGVDPKAAFEVTYTVIIGERAYEAKARLQ